MSPLISVVMPVYNCEKFVRAAIESIQNQSYEKIEILVVDDASTDHSYKIAEEMAKIDKRIHLIRNSKNIGVAKTRNNGIKVATGEWIALLDSDDVWEADKLERQLELAQKTGTSIVYCSYDFIDETGAKIKKPFIVPKQTNFKKMLVSSVISCSTSFVKTELMQAHPFDSSFYHEDYVLWMELLRVSPIAYGDRKVLMHYRQVTGSRSNRKGNAAKERWKTYRKALNLNVTVSSWAFIRYAVLGIIKYYF